MRDDFCAFILSHGRAHNLATYDTLRKCGYTGRVYIVIDDEDETGDQYRSRFGDMVLAFSKKDIAMRFDEGDNFNDRRSVFYARNACFDLARQVGCRFFVQLDDDYTAFVYKFDGNLCYTERPIKDLDAVFAYLLEYYCSIPALAIAIGQGGDYIGGARSTTCDAVKTSRKCMNSFICGVDRPFAFVGRINEDVNTYALLGRRGELFLTILHVSLKQRVTQQSSGGMTELYLDSGTYVKTFYSVMYCPSSVKVAEMGPARPRIHHNIDWDRTVPLILSEEWRKGR